MVEFGYLDVEVLDEVVSGFKLTGKTPLTSIFPPHSSHPGAIGHRRLMAPALREKVRDRCKPSG